ncbi:MAG: amidohydrolase family protein [Anaerolineaceae bacterium]|nr:amidohydrolase family protein [Anaerolineaceae bacterium]
MSTRKIIITGATLINGIGSKPMENSVVFVSDGKITDIGTPNTLTPPPDSIVIQADGKFLLPGLIDAHVHMAHSGFIQRPFKGSRIAYQTLIALNNLSSALQSGITTLRGVCDEDHIDLAMRSAVRDKFFIGPRLFVAGKGICMTGGHGSQLSGVMHEVDGTDEVRKAVREEVKAGVDFIKLLSSHRTDYPEFSLEEICAGTDEAHRLGKKIAIHAANFESTRMAAIAGVDTIEHGSFIDEKTGDLMAEKGIIFVPTIWVKDYIAVNAKKMLEEFGDKGSTLEILLNKDELEETSIWFNRCIEQYPKTFEVARSRGIHIATGTDNVFADEPFAMLHKEMELLTRYGFSNMEVIESATRIGAETIGIEESLGTIETGKLADLIMVDRDPLQDITVMGEVSWVMKDGEIIPFLYERKRQPIKESLSLD